MEPEIKAMSEIADALKDLDPDAVRRVIKWVIDKHQVKQVPAAVIDRTNGDANPTHVDFGAFHELFDAAKPTTGLDKVLVAAYWFQVVLKYDGLDSQDLNKELKHMGYASTNITRDLDNLINRSPRLVMQVRKEGKHKQARRRYKLTREGIRAVEKMLGAPENAGDGMTNP